MSAGGVVVLLVVTRDVVNISIGGGAEFVLVRTGAIAAGVSSFNVRFKSVGLGPINSSQGSSMVLNLRGFFVSFATPRRLISFVRKMIYSFLLPYFNFLSSPRN
jgi:hypothetical protein